MLRIENKCDSSFRTREQNNVPNISILNASCENYFAERIF